MQAHTRGKRRRPATVRRCFGMARLSEPRSDGADCARRFVRPAPARPAAVDRGRGLGCADRTLSTLTGGTLAAHMRTSPGCTKSHEIARAKAVGSVRGGRGEGIGTVESAQLGARGHRGGAHAGARCRCVQDEDVPRVRGAAVPTGSGFVRGDALAYLFMGGQVSGCTATTSDYYALSCWLLQLG